jgi:ribosome-binding factor A
MKIKMELQINNAASEEQINEAILHYIQKQIQDENVKHGLTRCSNESKEKSLAKLKGYLQSQKERHVKIQINDDVPLEFPYPTGKSKQDLVYVLY